MSDLRPLRWIGSSYRDLNDLPKDVRQTMGFALFRAQAGDEHPRAKALSGFGGRGVLEIVERHDGGTYRAVYTVRLAKAIYVLHCFQKKAKRGAATPREDVALIRSRLAEAERVDREQGDEVERP